ncbi:MAG: hypothetical protein WAQ52_07550 [Terriglobales bacterium]
MPKRLPILVVLACLWSAGAGAESISFQRDPALVSRGHPIAVTASPDLGSHAIAGDLGRGFSNTGRRWLLRAGSRESQVEGGPRGSLVTSVNRRLNFGFYRSSQGPPTGMDAFSDLLLQTLFERKPKGPRGRRELAEANAR